MRLNIRLCKTILGVHSVEPRLVNAIQMNSPVCHFCDKQNCSVMQEASNAHSKTADSDTVSTYQVSSVHLVTDKKPEALNKA